MAVAHSEARGRCGERYTGVNNDGETNKTGDSKGFNHVPFGTRRSTASVQ